MILVAKLLLGFLTAFALAQPLKEVEIGLAGNFSAIEDRAVNRYGDFLKAGAGLAVDELAPDLARHGLKVRLRYFDFGTDKERPLLAAQEAVASPVLAVVGYISSSEALVGAGVFEKGRLLLMTPKASNDRLADIGPYVRGICANDSYQGRTMAAFALHRGLKNVGIAAVSDCAYCQALKDAFVKSFTGQGGTIAGTVDFLSSDDKLGDLEQVFRGHAMDAVFLPNNQRHSGLVIARMIALKLMPGHWLGGDAMGNVGALLLDRLPSSGSNGFAFAYWFESMDNPRSRRFKEAYRKAVQLPFNDTAAMSYDAMRLVLQGLVEAKSPTREGLVAAVDHIRAFDSISGPVTFAAGARFPARPGIIIEVNGEHVTLAETLSPP